MLIYRACESHMLPLIFKFGTRHKTAHCKGISDISHPVGLCASNITLLGICVIIAESIGSTGGERGAGRNGTNSPGSFSMYLRACTPSWIAGAALFLQFLSGRFYDLMPAQQQQPMTPLSGPRPTISSIPTFYLPPNPSAMPPSLA